MLVIDANVLIDYPSGDAGWIAIPTSTLVGSNGWDRYIVLANRNETRIMRLSDLNGQWVWALVHAGQWGK